MLQEQLVEYISTQLKAGVAPDAVRAALLGAGWQAADVEDTLKKVQAGPTSSPSAAVSPASTKPAASPITSSPVAASPSKPEPTVIRVSDLVSGSASSAAATSVSATSSSMPASTVSSAKTDAVMSKIAPSKTSSFMASPSPMGSSSATMMPAKKSHSLAIETILGILMVLFGGAAVFFFFANQGLASQLASLNSQSNGVSTQLTQLQGQLSASTTALQADVQSMTQANAALALNLSFYVVPPGGQATTTFTTALSGTVSGGGKYSYVITTQYGAKIIVANSKDARVVTLLQPLVGETGTPVQFAGNYTPGVTSIILTAVNGVSVTPPPTVSTSTATSTSSSTAQPPTAQ